MWDPEFLAVWEAADLDGNGEISYQEAVEGMAKLGMENLDIDAAFAHYDYNGDDVLSRDEMNSAYNDFKNEQG